MKKLFDIYQIDAFTDEPFQGNSAGVVYFDELSDKDMQSIAREMNVSETAFLSKSDKADFNLRWFTPKVEVKLCGHATIASIHYLVERGIVKKNTEVSFNTLSGILKSKCEDDLYYLNLPIPKIEKFEGKREEILEAISINLESIHTNFPFLIADKSYLYIYVKSLESLREISPNFTALKNLTDAKKEFEAVTVFTTETFLKNYTAHLRFFAPYFGIDEDPVTGSANGPLLLVLKELGLIGKNIDDNTFSFEQGDFVGRKGRVKVTYSAAKNKLVIAGKAITILKGEIIF
ncbi:MAG: PhzF family phenazine biosynthesis protein [Ignavibacteria bacterium]|nr:PhzF family phenazine biosynthesis protein [Ignavibacteria bacterium]MBT8380901.1 PhzF family phenazine biosynthesis protein [Ignavibacteria bacterium]MBT8391020.1 PhzF family phenazine biosynthesis protein [Ignavibacteria bacterium]NNJ54168.1 PhzF family phenazine biosynthesis protein [Ignavibacteriaceae bacterium]NNL20675.1 PhzF family phenazine biosynthesis protein [Ignavibacteriaceae bacterium]